MEHAMRRKVIFLTATLLLALTIIFVSFNDAGATYITILNEDFTLPWGSWPWFNWDRLWRVLPTSGYRWGIAPDISQYPFEPLQSIWCAGLLGGQISNIEPFEDPYPPNLNTKAIWGPFSLASALAAECYFFYWNDTQLPNDYLLWGAALDQNANTIYEAARHTGPNTDWEWSQGVIDLADLTTPSGAPISLLGQPNVWIVFLFHSDGNVQTTWGGFVDDIVLGYDDGLFDLVAEEAKFYLPEDTSMVYPLQEGVEYLVGFEWSCEGIGQTAEFTIECEIDEEIWHSERTTATGGQSYITFLDSTYMSVEIGSHNLYWRLDTNDEIGETYEDNNVKYFPFQVIQFDSLPQIEILRPVEGDTANQGFRIEWEDYDRESNALVSLYYDSDSIGTNGFLINVGQTIYEDSSPDSFYWNTSNIPSGTRYWIYGKIVDYVNAPVFDYSEGPLTIYRGSGVADPSLSLDEFKLMPNYPNPFNASTNITFATPEKADVELTVYDVEGRMVENLFSGEVFSGTHTVSWIADVSSGLYFCKIRMIGVNSGKVFNSSQKMLLVR